MGGAQPLAATMNEATCIVADVDPAHIDFRLRTRYVDVRIDDLDEAIDQALEWKEAGVAKSIGVPCNAAMDNCVSEVLIRQTADAIVERGLAERGYEYVNLWVLLIPSTPHSFRGRSRDTRSSC